MLLLPTDYWLAGGAAAVALSFLALALAPGAPLLRLFRSGVTLPLPAAPWLREAIGWLSFALFALLIGSGFTGPSDPLANPLPLTVWTMIWVLFTLLTAMLGDLWRLVNPWIAPFRLARRLGIARRAPMPEWARALGHWPAVAGLLGFGWFELVHVSPQDPVMLARLALAYWMLTFALMLQFGEEWLRRGDFLTLFLRLVARLSPISASEGRLRLGLPGARLVEARPLPISAVVFVTAALATVTFDGLARTFWWLDQIGINPLDFPGRSAVVGVHSLGYLATCAVMTGALAGAVLLGRRIAPAPVPARDELGRLALTLMPIALGYHASHYLTVLLVNGQYWLAAVGAWAGYGRDHVTTSFFYDRDAVRAIWAAQAGAVIVGHLLAVLLAHLVALRLHSGDRRAAALGQLPLAALMVLYTLLGLWLLASPTVA